MIIIVEFHPVRVGLFNTLNWAETLASSIRKHPLEMFLYDKKYFFARSNVAWVVFITNLATAAPPGKSGVGPGFGGTVNAVPSNRRYTAGFIARPDHPCITLWGQDSCASP